MSVSESVLALRKHTLKDLGVKGNDVSKIPKQHPEKKKMTKPVGQNVTSTGNWVIGRKEFLTLFLQLFSKLEIISK